MNVLLTTPSFPPLNSGLGNAVRQQALALSDRDCSVVVATGGERRGSRCDPISGATVEEFGVSGAAFFGHPLRGDVEGFARFLALGEFDVVLMNAWQTWSTDIGLRNLERIRGRKYVYSHGISTNLFLGFQPLRSAARYLAWRPYWWSLADYMRRLDGMIFLAGSGCDCRFDDLAVARRLEVPYTIIPNAISPAAARSLCNLPAGRHTRDCLIAVGSYDRMKGHDFVLSAYARSPAKNKLPLKIFGQAFTPFTDVLRQQASGLGIADAFVQFNQGVGDDALIAEYRTAIALISGSRTECQPLILLDAMATGTPFVARATGCIPSLPGGMAVTTVDDTARVIGALGTDTELWQQTSEAGITAAKSRYHPDVVGDVLLAKLVSG